MNKNITFRKSDIPVPENYLKTKIEFNEKKTQNSSKKPENPNQKNQSKKEPRKTKNVTNLNSAGIELKSAINRSKSSIKQIMKNRISLLFFNKKRTIFSRTSVLNPTTSQKKNPFPTIQTENRDSKKKKKKTHIIEKSVFVVPEKERQMKNSTANKKINRVSYSKTSYNRDAMTILIINKYFHQFFMFDEINFNDIATATSLYLLMSDSKKKNITKSSKKS